jgi:hypothetical protein
VEKSGKSSPGSVRFKPYWLTTGPLVAAYGPETGTLVCLHREARKARTGALTASQQNGIEKPGFDPRFSVFLAALEGLRGPI